MTDDDEGYPSTAPPGPRWPDRGGVREDVGDRCRDEREELTARETADCAGEKTAELYENEEDGGS